MELVIDVQGMVRCLYSEALPLERLGRLAIVRASQVEPDPQGRWWADLGLSSGPLLGPFTSRSGALAAEAQWLEAHRLNHAARPSC